MGLLLTLTDVNINWYDTTSCHFDSGDDYRTEVVKTSVTVNNSPIHDYMYVHPDDHAEPTHA